VDDFLSWRRFVATMLQDHPVFRIVGEATDGLEAIHKSAELQPCVVLLDIGLPELNGIEVARQIYEISPNSKILFVSENRCPAVVREALRSSVCARGYVVKSDACSDLLPALEAATQDQHFVSPRFQAFKEGDFPDA
jgi:DNA-binding NarL/FixJ family response regulator